MRRLLCAVVLALIVGGCSSDKPPAAVLGPGGTTTSGPPGEIVLSVKSFQIEATVAPAPGEPEAAQLGVLRTLQAYLTDASLGPLRSGTLVGDISGLFSDRAGPRATSAPDRAALYDEGLPPVEGLRSDGADIGLTGLVTNDGKLAVVAAHFTVRLNGLASGSPIVVQRDADFVLVPEGGTWRIDSYDVRASRDTPAGATTTTAVSK